MFISLLFVFALLVFLTEAIVMVAASTDAVRRSTIVDDSDERSLVVGGFLSNPDDFPYFVYAPCGGALITPDVVLTAGHCGNLTNKAIIVSAYKANSNYIWKSQERFCEVWIRHPDYGQTKRPHPNDIALCKLANPVYIDQSKTKLVLNSDPNIPVASSTFSDNDEAWIGDSLIAMGLGVEQELKKNGTMQEFLNDVTLTYISNEQCNTSKIMNGRIKPSMLCAGHKQGERDMCSGDSGGPLIKRVVNSNDGSITHFHVGVVSGGEGCGRPNKPGVYARTSVAYDWIQQTTCDVFKSIDTGFCPNNKNVDACPSDRNLTVSITTDQHPTETSWKVVHEASNQTIMSENRYRYKFFHHNYNSVCLEENECYKFEIKDVYGDGLCAEEHPCGNYTITLGDKIQGIGNGKFGRVDIINDICTVSTKVQPNVPTNLPTTLSTAAGPITVVTKPPTPPPTEAPTLPPTNKSIGVLSQPLSPPTDPPTKVDLPTTLCVNKEFCDEFLSVKKKRGEDCGKDKNIAGGQTKKVREWCPTICKKYLCRCNDRKKSFNIGGKQYECRTLLDQSLCKKKDDSFGFKVWQICPNKCNRTDQCFKNKLQYLLGM